MQGTTTNFNPIGRNTNTESVLSSLANINPSSEGTENRENHIQIENQRHNNRRGSNNAQPGGGQQSRLSRPIGSCNLQNNTCATDHSEFYIDLPKDSIQELESKNQESSQRKIPVLEGPLQSYLQKSNPIKSKDVSRVSCEMSSESISMREEYFKRYHICNKVNLIALQTNNSRWVSR